jgi:PAS domain S-box-containing protein
MPQDWNQYSAPPRRIAGQIALTYAALGALWIVGTDALLAMFAGTSEQLTYVQTIKGWIFILLTALLTYWLIRTYATAVQRSGSQLEHSERSHRRIVETANEGICTVDNAGRVLLANRRLGDMVGYHPQELIGQPLLTVVDEEFRDELGRRILDGASASQCCDVKLRGKDGQEVWAIAAISPMSDEGRRHVGSLVMLTDISDRKRLESQLLQFQKMEALGQLAGGIAHDFNNIITAILGNVDLMRLQLKRRPVPVDSLAADIEQVEQAGERAMGLTHQLLTFSRRQVVRPEIVDPKRLLINMEKMLSRLIREDIQLKIVASEDVPTVRADVGQFEQVVVNLVVNARDAMPEGGKLTVEASRIDLDEQYVGMHPGAEPGPHVLITVTDIGRGMDKRTLQRIFEPFFTTKPVGQGTGLGLATVYGIVKQFGGHVNAYSEPGMGSTFKVYLPAAEEEPVAARPAQAVPNSSAAGGSETVLVCEDNEAIRKLIGRVLEEKGYRGLLYDSPAAALEAAESHDGSIQLLITDVVMRDMSGPELAEHLRASRPRLKVLFVSGYPSDVIDHHGLLAEGTDFLAKPFSADVLVRRVRQVLDAANRENAPA